MHDPLVSIIIPTFNRPDILSDTIKNVLEQSWKNTQIIFIDDGTSGKSKEIIQSFSDSRILYKKTNENLGCAGARKIGVQISEGDYITFLDDDDEWKKNYLIHQLQKFKEDISLDLVICDYQVQSNNTERQIYNMEPFCKNFKQLIHQRPGPFFQCCMFTNKILENIDELLDSKAVPSEDWDFFMNLAMRNPSIAHSPYIDFKWNYSKSSQSANLLLEAKSLEYIVRNHRKSIIKICGRIILSDHYRRIARINERINNFSLVNKNYKKAFKSAPWWWKNILYLLLLSLGPKIGLQLITSVRKLRNNIE
ncbi:MAG: glycosyltransferase family 2 protein [Candidatus Marinimicrobia bacterium]|nr:glycosyltransferase family 2 protein [Candidatus Neomarinimicrobiota bacterium]